MDLRLKWFTHAGKYPPDLRLKWFTHTGKYPPEKICQKKRVLGTLFCRKKITTKFQANI